MLLMSKEVGFDMAVTHETRSEPQVIYLGRLGDLGLGNPEGIPSRLAEASESDIQAYGENLAKSLDVISDNSHDGCIDGRCVMCNADGSAPEIRQRQVGGSGARVEESMNAEAELLAKIDLDAPIQDIAKQVDDYFEQETSVKPSAHTGVCGGVGGAIEDNEEIGNNPAILGVTQTFMGISEIANFTEMKFDEGAADKVRIQAPKTAQFLRSKKWIGQDYVDSVTSREPAGVEELETADDQYKGHSENALVVVLSHDKSISEDKLKALNLGDVFVWTLKRSVEKAHAAGGPERATQYLIANIAKHMAVANRLPSDKTPVYIIADY
jgi:hypothetical protein